MKKLLVVLGAGLFAAAVARDADTWTGINKPTIGTNPKVLIVGIDTLHTSFVDNVHVVPESMYPDSLLQIDAEMLYEFEIASHLSVNKTRLSGATFREKLAGLHYSQLEHDTAQGDSVSASIARIATEAGAELVVVPYLVSVVQSTIQPKGWRESQAYQRPVETMAQAKVVVQLWDAKGHLYMEMRRQKMCSKPFAYDAMKKLAVRGKDPADYARKMFAPPGLKAVYGAMDGLFR